MTATTTTRGLRPELPPLPLRLTRLPIDARGYPVPWFVDWIDGKPDFRIMDGRKLAMIVRGERRCWTCGQPLGSFVAFVVGPMCAVNRVSAEPPSHRDCARYAAIACPFLTRPKAHRREAGLPEGYTEPAGMMIERNPGVALVWVTKSYKLVDTGQKASTRYVFRMGEPTDVECWAEGRAATPEEIRASVDSGLPLLQQACDLEHGEIRRLQARQDLERQVAVARRVLAIADQGTTQGADQHFG